MLSSILEILGGLFHFDFSAITDNIVTLVLAVPVGLIGIFAMSYLGRRRKTIDHERMATIIKGLHYAGVKTGELVKKPAPDSHAYLMRGLRWLFGGLGVSGALYTYGSVEPVADAGEAIRGAL